MKYSILLTIILPVCLRAFSQNNTDPYHDANKNFNITLLPGPKAEVETNGVLKFELLQIEDNSQMTKNPDFDTYLFNWMLNGEAQPDPSYGRMENTKSQGKLLSIGVVEMFYHAPNKVPSKNPVTLSVEITRPDTKTKVILVCNITINDGKNQVLLNGANGLFNNFYIEMKELAAKGNQTDMAKSYLAAANLTAAQKQQAEKAMSQFPAEGQNMKATYYTRINKMIIMQTWPGTSTSTQRAANIEITLDKPDTGTFSFSLKDNAPQPGVMLVLPQYPAPLNPSSFVSVDGNGGDSPPFTLQGTVHVTECGGPGERIKGSYAGRLMGADPVTRKNKTYVTVQGQFDCVRTSDK